MKMLDAMSRAGRAVALVVLSTALSGCYYYVPYGYVPYGVVPAAAAPPQYSFSTAATAADGAAVPDATVATNT